MTPLRLLTVVTCAERPEVTSDDALLLECLPDGVRTEGVPWSDDVAWHEADLVLLRSCWDYHLRWQEFRAWLEQLQRQRVPVANDARIVLWNAEKTYLRELERVGCHVVPTAWLTGAELERDPGAVERVRAALEARGWDRAVAKPVVSASGLHTWTTSPDEIGRQEEVLRAAAAHGDLMLQPFLEEIVQDGEWSLLFFDGEFSHGVRKRARPGDFRVQSDFGGTAALEDAPPQLVEDARGVLELARSACGVSEAPLFARIDGVERGGRLLLVEAELIEPELFLALSPEAPRRFAEALCRRMV